MMVRYCAVLLALTSLLAAAPASAVDSNGAIDALGERYWQREVRYDYSLRAVIGKPVEAIRAIAPENAHDDAQFGQGVLDELKTIDVLELDHDHWLTYRTLEFLSTNLVASEKYYWLTQQATPYAGGAQLAELSAIFAGFKFANAGDAQRYQTLLHQYAAFVNAMGDLLKGQHERKIILPDVESQPAANVFEGYAKQAGSLVPQTTRLKALSAADASALHDGAAKIVAGEVAPAFESVAAYLRGAYREGAPTRVGLSQYPGGAEYYQYLIYAHTTLSTSPEKLHELGLQGVSELNKKLDAIRKQVAFSGDLAAFKRYLATDKRFFVKTPEAFGDRLELYVHRAAAAAPSFFKKMPTAPFGVEPLPKELAGSQTFGYYDQPTATKPYGHYLYNAWHPDKASVLGAGALICHELIPGHHFQIALQQENTALPNVRHYDFSETGFVEGWGEYASQLCTKMGVYKTPYDQAGRIMQDLMVSTRLVVDTGMNALGWSRERAMQYMRDNLTISEAQIESESLRYSTDIPGQALAYKTGELTMLALRDRARKELGSHFDIRRFHGWMIDSGSMTLDTLSKHVDYEIALQKTGH